MLKVSHLTKRYKTKGGQDVLALNDVTLTFPERGMVFLLGKSGSGKSTLLNVCGGLDSPTSGEVIVKGKSSSTFSQSDFDSYRNTFVGFVFQEYNILNEFSVEDNVALALELQGKPKDKKAVAALLEQVDLVGYAKRKPNTLSGGQKQRIAIARALIKSPEIIMADEPTGALDSATGKQVLDTLKKLSKDKLVLVVSHDREFAEQYGDRVIELKDGKVLSDISKTTEAQVALSENLTAVGETLCVKQGKRLTEADFTAIKAFLQKSEGDVVIASGNREVKAFKTAARITERGEKEVFRQTEEKSLPQKTYTAAESRFIRSKLPLRHAVKIGASGLKTKPVRLIFTALLCTVAFTLFGLLSTMTFYNSKATFRQTVKDTDPTVVRFLKTYRSTQNEYAYGKLVHTYNTRTQDAAFSYEEVAAIAQRFGAEAFAGESFGRYISLKADSDYYYGEFSYAAFLPEDHSLRSTILGEYPSAKNHIAISSYIAESIVACDGYDAYGEGFAVKTSAELIGKELNFGDKENYVITGIFQSGKLSAKYDALKQAETGEDDYDARRKLERSLRMELEDGLHRIALFSKEGLTALSNNRYYSYYDEFENRAVSFYDQEGLETHDYGHYGAITNYLEQAVFFAQGKTSPSSGEAVVSAEWWVNRVRFWIEDQKIAAENELYGVDEAFVFRIVEADDSYDEWGARLLLDSWKWGTDSPQETDALSSVYRAFLQEAEPLLAQVRYWQGLLEDCEVVLYQKEWENAAFTQEYAQKRAESLARLVAASERFPLQTTSFRVLDCGNGMPIGEMQTVTAVGICDAEALIGQKSTLLFSPEEASALWEGQKNASSSVVESVTSYRHPKEIAGNFLFLSYDGSNQATNAVANAYFDESYDETDSRMEIYSSFADRFATVDDFVKSASKVFLYIGLVLAVFAVLLLSNFISVSISQKKREIGILRAVGARGLDVFKIFFAESAIITGICVLLSVFCSVLLCGVLNAQIASGIGASIFVFGIASFAVLVAIALAACVVATFLPVWNAAKKKPVDSIRAL